MKINWKKVSRSVGYISLKKAYVADVQKIEAQRKRGQRPIRDKKEFRKLFEWVIGRAQHCAAHQAPAITIEHILLSWECGRANSWWLNSYGGNRQEKFHTNHLKPIGARGSKKYYKRSGLTKMVRTEPTTRLGKKKRWSKSYKQHKQRMAKYA